MKKVAFLTILFAAVFVVFLSVFFWLSGSLFLRLSSAAVTANGVTSDRNEVYKSGNGEYLIFIERDDGKPRTYIVFSKDKEVGLPNRPIPSFHSKSIKTEWFVFCWHTDSVLAGTDKLDRNAKLELLPNKINFQIYNDDIVVSF